MRKLMAVFAMAAIVAFSAPSFAATNPFMDVPQGHWAYDAVALLASRGMVVGYPDGAFKGAQPATRYELAAVVARAVAAVDAEKASAQDMELLKKLVMEFKDELDALGVKVDELDKRVAVVEEAVGGWKFSGRFYFDANFAGGDQTAGSSYTEGGDNSFEKAQFRLYLEKQISETTSFYAEFRAGAGSAGDGTSGLGDITQINVRNLWVDTVLPWDIDFRVGRFFLDFEDDHGLYIDNEPLFGDYRVDGFQLAKTWDHFSAKAIIGRNSELEPISIFGIGDQAIDDTATTPTLYSNYMNSYMVYALDLTWQPSEVFFLGVNGVWAVEDGNGDEYLTANSIANGNLDYTTYSAYFGYNFTPAIQLSGVYYAQEIGEALMSMMSSSSVGGSVVEDSTQAWKVALDFSQDLLKLTSLRLEYVQQGNSFIGWRDPYQFGGSQDASNAATVAGNMPWNDQTTTFIFAYAEQQWNDKWSSYLRYTNADFDTTGIDGAQSYGIGITYQYTPAVAFRLAYDLVDYGVNDTTTSDLYTGKDNVFQFRTMINF